MTEVLIEEDDTLRHLVVYQEIDAEWRRIERLAELPGDEEM
jgi:hypothetical protein